jgi:hypothetical protein
MPTYQVRSIDEPEFSPTHPFHVLVCAQCEEAFRGMRTRDGTNGMTAGEVKALWPDVAEEVTRHERE